MKNLQSGSDIMYNIMENIINYKLYTNYRYFVIQHYKDLEYDSITTLLKKLRDEIFDEKNKYKLKNKLEDLKNLQSSPII